MAMKLEIELDLNKIDYDAINQQIQEKLAALDIKETYDINSRVDHMISVKIEDEVENTYNDYIDYWHKPTLKGKDLIKTLTEEKITDKVTKELDRVFEEIYDEKAITKLISSMLPNIITAILFDSINDRINCAYHDQLVQQQSIMSSQIANMLYNKGIL